MQKIENVVCSECGERNATISACDGCGIASLKCECGHTLKLDEKQQEYDYVYPSWGQPPSGAQ